MIENLLEEGQLMRITPNIEKTKKSLQLAKNKLEKAKEEYNAQIFDSALISAYTSMFHSARALLFKDGFKERTHYAVYQYIREEYRDKISIKYINELNILRTIRHKVIYGDEKIEGKEIQEAEAKDAIKVGKEFLDIVGKLL